MAISLLLLSVVNTFIFPSLKVLTMSLIWRLTTQILWHTVRSPVMLPPWGSGCDWQEPGATRGPELGRRARSLAQGDGDKQHLRPEDSTMEHRDRKQTEKMGRLSSINTFTHTPYSTGDVEIHFTLLLTLLSWLHTKGKIESRVQTWASAPENLSPKVWFEPDQCHMSAWRNRYTF